MACGESLNDCEFTFGLGETGAVRASGEPSSVLALRPRALIVVDSPGQAAIARRRFGIGGLDPASCARSPTSGFGLLTASGLHPVGY